MPKVSSKWLQYGFHGPTELTRHPTLQGHPQAFPYSIPFAGLDLWVKEVCPNRLFKMNTEYE